VEYVGVPVASTKDKYDVAVAANEVPDIGGMQSAWVSDLAARGALLPLDAYFDKWTEKNKISQSEIESKRVAVADGKLYVIPTTANMDIFWYRVDWFKEAGLTAPQTWDEFFNAIQKLTDPTKNRYGYTIRGGPGSAAALQKMMLAYSGINVFFDANGKSTINDPKHVEFVKKYLGLYKKYTPESDLTNGYKEMVAAFDTGVAAMMEHNLGSYGEHMQTLGTADKFAAFAFPKSPFNGKKIVESANSNGFSIFKGSKHPDEAWAFLSFLANSENQSYFNENIGQIPTHTDSLQSEWVKKTQHIQVVGQVMTDKDMVINNRPLQLPDYNNIHAKVVEPGIQSVMLNKKTAENFLNEWAQALEKAQKEYNDYVKTIKK
jgi:multiple sugar transport system substrate-binding protein